jgi:MoxR-like ATPase
MNDDAFNMGLRKFLKQVGVTSQRALEEAARAAEAQGKLKGRRAVRATMVLTVEEIGLRHVVEDDIPLE